MFLQFVINGLITGVLYSLAALGFALVYNTTRIFHIAAAAIYVAAAYFFYFGARVLELPLWLAAPLALVLSALLSVACEYLVYRPLHARNASPNVVMISSIGLMTVLVNLVAMLFGNETKILDNTIQPTYRLGTLIVTHTQLLQLLLGSLALALFALFLRFSPFGLRTKALGNDPVLFAILGYDTRATRTLVFALSGFFLAASSCLSAHDVGMNPHMGMTLLLNAMVAMIIGGIGRFNACVAGGLLLGLLQALVVYQFSANWQNAITFLALLFFLFLRPQGLFGRKQRLV
jgi:branched-chain amino acid transport system permease protein